MSIPFDAMTEYFDEVTILNKPALFTCLRIDRNTVPSGYNAYDVRHDDNCRGNAVELERFVLANHWGTLITNEEISLRHDGFLRIKPRDINYSAGDCQSMKEFMEKYPPITRPPITKSPKSYER